MQSVKQTLEKIGDELIKEIRKRLATRGFKKRGMNDTGGASKSLNAAADNAGTKLEIKGVRYIGALDKGRGPTIGGGIRWTVESMMDWVDRKLGIPKPKNKSIAFAIQNKIHKFGTLLYQKDPRYEGLELEEVKKMGTEKIKKEVTEVMLKNVRGMVRDLSKGAAA